MKEKYIKLKSVIDILYANKTIDDSRIGPNAIAEIGGFGLRIKFSDGCILDYSSSDNGYLSWAIIDGTKRVEESENETD